MDTQILDLHKNVLKNLVKLKRDGIIPDEFTVMNSTRVPCVLSSKGEFMEIPGCSVLGLEALTRAGFLFSLARIERRSSDFGGSVTEQDSEQYRSCYITPEGFRAVDNDFSPIPDLLQHRPPVEITSSLAAFRSDYPDPTRLAFIMMQFGDSTGHQGILS